MQNPIGRRAEPFGEEADVEAQMPGANIDRFFFAREQIEEQRGEAGVVQDPGDEAVTLAMPAAAAAVSKEDDATRGVRHGQIALELWPARGNFDFARGVHKPSG